MRSASPASTTRAASATIARPVAVVDRDPSIAGKHTPSPLELGGPTTVRSSSRSGVMRPTPGGRASRSALDVDEPGPVALIDGTLSPRGDGPPGEKPSAA